MKFLAVFFEGVVSFFSPCVLPLIPLYMGYMAGNAEKEYKKKNIFFNTLFFVIGISAAFFILGVGFSSLGSLLKEYRGYLSLIGGIIIILLGINQLGFFKIGFLNKEVRLTNKANNKNMNPLSAFVMGFSFSFAWTPCVGPILGSVLILASNADTALEGNLLVLLYSLGFLIPFLVLGVFTGYALNFIKKRAHIMDKIVKAGAAVLIIIGSMLFATGIQVISADKTPVQAPAKVEEPVEDEKSMLPPIELKDQHGKLVKLSDFKGKVVFLNIFATWCGPCQEEIPDIQKLYEERGYNKEDVAVIGVVSPDARTEGSIQDFVKEYKITYPVLIDEDGSILQQLGISSFPTTFMVDKEGRVFGYVPGGLTYEMMNDIVDKTLAK